jgi:hypothetical protein
MKKWELGENCFIFLWEKYTKVVTFLSHCEAFVLHRWEFLLRGQYITAAKCMLNICKHFGTKLF